MSTDEGRFYEDLRTGERIVHGNGRTLTDVDNIWFTLLTCNNNPIHFNVDYTKRFFSHEPFKGRLAVNAYLVLAIVVGLSVNDTSRNGIMLGERNLKFFHPVFAGDTLYAQSKILSKRPSKTHKNMGLVEVRTEGFNQDKEKILELERTIMVRKRGKKWI